MAQCFHPFQRNDAQKKTTQSFQIQSQKIACLSVDKS